MPKFSANLSMLFGEHEFLDRFDAAARAGFKGSNISLPYDHAPDVVAARLKKNGLTQVLFNLPAGDWASGERGIAVLPDRVEEFRDGRRQGHRLRARRSAARRSTVSPASRRRARPQPCSKTSSSRICASPPKSWRKPASSC